MAHLLELGPVIRSSGSVIGYLCFACFCLFFGNLYRFSVSSVVSSSLQLSVKFFVYWRISGLDKHAPMALIMWRSSDMSMWLYCAVLNIGDFLVSSVIGCLQIICGVTVPQTDTGL